MSSTRKTTNIRNAEISEIIRLLTCFRTDQDIMKQLSIPRRTYYRYKAQIMRESAEQFKNQTLEEIALNKDILHDRLTQFLRLLSEKLENSNEGTRDLPGLFNVARELAIQIYELDTQGISIVSELKKLANSGDAEARRLLNISEGDDKAE